MKKIIVIILLSMSFLMGHAQLAKSSMAWKHPFTREEYFAEYLTIAKIEVAASNIWLMLSVIPMNDWRPEVTRIVKPIALTPAMAFSFVKTIEYTLHNVVKRTPKSFIRCYTPRMLRDKNGSK